MTATCRKPPMTILEVLEYEGGKGFRGVIQPDSVVHNPKQHKCHWWNFWLCKAPIRACALDWQCDTCFRTSGIWNLNKREVCKDSSS